MHGNRTRSLIRMMTKAKKTKLTIKPFRLCSSTRQAQEPSLARGSSVRYAGELYFLWLNKICLDPRSTFAGRMFIQFNCAMPNRLGHCVSLFAQAINFVRKSVKYMRQLIQFHWHTINTLESISVRLLDGVRSVSHIWPANGNDWRH